MNSKNPIIILFLLVLGVFAGWYFYNKNDDKPLRTLAYFGPKHTVKINDTAYHTIADFSFVNQYGKTITQEDLKGKIYVSNSFFTTYKSICPIMNKELTKVYKAFRSRNDFMILSLTVDPETDSIQQLALHAKNYGVSDDKWWFATGSKKDIYELTRKSFMLTVEEGDGGADDFIHTQNFALIDKEKHIRGFYDGTDSIEVVRLITDIKTLLKEYEYKNKNTL
ncbi:MAG: SCO family protein [Sphingobacteriaceae bacterium]|nr:SCO family protein [Sphingobacteriaceae bacterium]